MSTNSIWFKVYQMCYVPILVIQSWQLYASTPRSILRIHRENYLTVIKIKKLMILIRLFAMGWFLVVQCVLENVTKNLYI